VTDAVPLRRNARFQLLWLGSATSQLGSELTNLTKPLLVLALTGSAGLAGVVAGSRTAAYVLAQLPAGTWVDRADRRRVLLTGQAVQLVNATVLALLVVTDRVQVQHLVLAGVVDGICAAFVNLAHTTAIRGIVPSEQLPAAFAQEESRSHAAKLAGPPLGGLLHGFGRAVPFVVDALTFTVALLCSLGARVPRRPAGERPGTAAQEKGEDRGAERTRRSMLREAGEAVTWVWRQPGLRAACAVVAMLNLLGGSFLLPVIVLVGERGGDALTTGTVLAAVGIGGLVGALLSGRTVTLLPPGKLLITFVTLFGVALVVMPLPLGTWWPMVPLALVAFSTPALNVGMEVVLARMVPEQMLGRAGAVLTTTYFGLAPLGPVLGGTAATLLGGAGALVLVGGLLLLTAAGAASSRVLRAFTGEAPEDSTTTTEAEPVS